MTPIKQERTFTTGEIAKYLGVNFRTVIRWIKKGRLKAYQLPGRGDNRVLLSDFLDFLKENRLNIPDELIPNKDRPQKILIVENEIPMAHAIERVLRPLKYEIQIANDGFQAGFLITLFKPDVLTLDLSMPGLSGLEVLKCLRQNEEVKNTKVLVISARSIEEIKETINSGADDYLQKPFTNEELIQKIQLLFDNKTRVV